MKINIITIHAMHNPGSTFQAYALQQYLRRRYIVEIIDYRPDYLYSENSNWKYWVKRTVFRKAYKSRDKKFNDFIYQNMELINGCSNYEDLSTSLFDADVYITGSDQLWNSDFPCGNDPAYYLCFIKEGYKISYSTSVGKKVIDNHNLNIIKTNTQSFKHLSVREESTSLILKRELKRNVQWVCDPVFLLSTTDYAKFLNSARPINEPYVMVYMSGKSIMLSELVNYYRKAGYKIVLAGGFTKRCYCDYHFKDVGPEDFLNLIYYADMIISSSFHATAFSLIFHKNFLTLLPSNNSERIESLLNLVNLDYRGISNSICYDEFERKIDWNIVDNKLKGYIKQSKDYLTNAIGE